MIRIIFIKLTPLTAYSLSIIMKGWEGRRGGRETYRIERDSTLKMLHVSSFFHTVNNV
jgi:hypothetical protein